MLYCDLTYLQGVMPLQKILECCDDFRTGLFDADVLLNLEAVNKSAVADVHLYCRGLYTVPFDPVPDEIRELTAQLMRCQLYMRRTVEEVPEAIMRQHKMLLEKLKAITGNTFRLDAGADAVAAAQGPRVNYTRHRFRQGFMGGLLDDDYLFPEFEDEAL